MPDLGTTLSPGNNAFANDNPPSGYRDLYYSGTLFTLMAKTNWWGEYPPNPIQVIGPVDYYGSALNRDPLPGNGRLGVDAVHFPLNFRLSQNSPNPFNPDTRISFSLENQSFVSLKVYNVAGQIVNTLLSENIAAGEHSIVWDGTNSGGENVASGIYFYILATDFGQETKTMTLIR